MKFRNYSFCDHILIELQNLFDTIVITHHNNIIYDDSKYYETSITKTNVPNLLRINHVGEICAQALYRGQAFVTHNDDLKSYLYNAAHEEYDHLLLCEQRLFELQGHKSVFNLFWYIGSFVIGSVVGMMNETINYSFIVETEKQVMIHLEKHLSLLPKNDKKTRSILIKMYEDEKEHAEQAMIYGGRELPFFIKMTMKLTAKIMTTISYYF